MTNHTNHEKRMRIMLINLILVFVVTALIDFMVTAVESVILWQILKKKYPSK